MLKKFLIGSVVALSVMVFTFASAADFGTTTLKVGSKGPAVVAVQTLVGATADGSFGPMTKAKVMAWQANNGLTADGLFGAMSKAKANGGEVVTSAGCPAGALFNSMTGASCTVVASEVPGCAAGALFSATTGASCTGAAVGTVSDGTTGSVDSWTKGSADKSSVREGQSNIEVFQIDAKLANEGDVQLQKADIYFSMDDAATANTKPWTYFKDVSLTVNGVEVATKSASSISDWTEYDTGTASSSTNKEYRMRFSGFNAILKSNATAEIGVRVSVNNTIDTLDQDAIWDISTIADSFKIVDGSGYATSEGVVAEDQITMGSTDKAVVKVYDATSNLAAHVIQIDATEDTNGVEISKFTIEETNGIKLDKIEEITMTFTSTTENDEAVTFRKVYLYDGSTLLGSESVTTGGAVTFNNLNLSVNGDSKKDITVKADLNDVAAGVDEGTTISVGAPNLTVFTDANGNDDGDITETVTHATVTHELRSTGIQAKFISSTITKAVACSGGCASGEAEQAQATIVFDVTAFGANAYLVNGVDEDGSYTAGSGLTTTTTGAGTSVGTYSVTGNSTSGTPTHTLILDGTTARVTLVVNITKTTPAGFVKAALSGIEWNDTDNTTTPVNYTLDLNNYKTSEIYLDFKA